MSPRSVCLLMAVLTASAAPLPAQTTKPIFWPPSPEKPRVQFLVSYTSGADVEPGSTIAIVKPYSVTMLNGRIYIADVRSGGVTVLDPASKRVTIMGGSGPGATNKAVDVAVAEDGFKYVVDAAGNQIQVFDADDKYVQTFAPPGAHLVSACTFKELLYLSDYSAQAVLVLDRKTGKQLRTIGSKGADDGQFVRPVAATADKDGNLYVLDAMKCRVQVFSPDGKFLKGFAETGNKPGNLVRPKRLTVDSDGTSYVVDAAFNNVQLFDRDGKYELAFGGPGQTPGSMDLPAGIHVSENPKDLDVFKSCVDVGFEAQRLVLVANQFGVGRVSVYAVGRPREPR